MSRRGIYSILNGNNGCHMVIHKRKRKMVKTENKTEKLCEKRINNLILNATIPEKILYASLSFEGIKFYFQYAIHSKTKFHIVDFYFPRGKRTPLVVEVDGGYHLSNRQKELDAKRTKWIFERTGCELIRFTNNEVQLNLKSVIAKIKLKLS